MGDLTEKQAGGTTKIVGADPDTGEENFFAEVTSEGELKISSFANVDFQDVNKAASGTEILAAVGGSNLTNRKSLIIYNRVGDAIYYGTTGVGETTGIEIEEGELITLLVGDNIDIYIATKAGGSATVTLQEFS